MQIRQIQPQEALLVAPLFDQYRVFYQQASAPAIAQQYLQERLNNKESIIFAAFADGQDAPIGFTQLYPSYSSVRAAKDWILNDLFVDQAHRKSGIGAALIQRVLDFATEMGATFVQLETQSDNHNAQKLYEKIGFKQQATDSTFFEYRYQLV